jgi:hypothetical protein
MQLLRADAIIEVYNRDVERTLIRENLKLSPQERLEKLMALQRAAAELRRAGQVAGQNAELEAIRDERDAE